MLRIRKLTDYGTVLLAAMDRQNRPWKTATELSQETHLSYATVGKLLKMLVRAHLLESQRGPHGGYRLARPAGTMTALEILEALEGKVAVIECGLAAHVCDRESFCAVSPPWQRINQVLRDALAKITLQDLTSQGVYHPSVRPVSSPPPLTEPAGLCDVTTAKRSPSP
jgi:FeS assembly SUF system regulator